MTGDDSQLRGGRHGADWMVVTAADEPLPSHPIDVSLELASALLRVGAYAIFAGFANRYDCGTALLTGVLTGDLIASAVRGVWRWQDGFVPALSELLVLGAIWLCVRSELVWPDCPAQRAILGLAAFGVLVSRLGHTALTRLGPSEHGLT